MGSSSDMRKSFADNINKRQRGLDPHLLFYNYNTEVYYE